LDKWAERRKLKMNKVLFLRFVGDEPVAFMLDARIPTVEEYVDM